MSQYNFAESDYPITLCGYREDNGRRVWRIVLRRPGAIYIPPLKKLHGVAIKITMTLANGTVFESGQR